MAHSAVQSIASQHLTGFAPNRIAADQANLRKHPKKSVWKQPSKRTPGIRIPGRYSKYCMLAKGRIDSSPSHSKYFQTNKLCSRSSDAPVFNVQHLQQTSLTKSLDSPASAAVLMKILGSIELSYFRCDTRKSHTHKGGTHGWNLSLNFSYKLHKSYSKSKSCQDLSSSNYYCLTNLGNPILIHLMANHWTHFKKRLRAYACMEII